MSLQRVSYVFINPNSSKLWASLVFLVLCYSAIWFLPKRGHVAHADQEQSLPVSLQEKQPVVSKYTLYIPQNWSSLNQIDWLEKHCTKDLQVVSFTFLNAELAQLYCDFAHKGIDVRIIINKGSRRLSPIEKALVDSVKKEGVKVSVFGGEEPIEGLGCVTIADKQYIDPGCIGLSDVEDFHNNPFRMKERALELLDKCDKLQTGI